MSEQLELVEEVAESVEEILPTADSGMDFEDEGEDGAEPLAAEVPAETEEVTAEGEGEAVIAAETPAAVEPATPAAIAQAAIDAHKAAEAEKGETKLPFDRAAARAHIVQTYAEKYTISEENAARLATEPEKVLPELLGEMAVDVYEAMYNTFIQLASKTIPQMIQRHSDGQGHKTKFMEAHPQIAEHIKANPNAFPQVAEAAAFWRKQNPAATPEEAVEGIGKLVNTMFKLSAPDPTVSAAAALVAKAKPIQKLPRRPAGANSAQARAEPEQSAMDEALGFELPDS